MSNVLKICLTPAMFLVALTLVGLGTFYYKVLVKMYEFAWSGWDE